MCLRSVVVVCRRVAATFSTHSSTRFKRNTQRVSVKTNALHFALANEPLCLNAFSTPFVVRRRRTDGTR